MTDVIKQLKEYDRYYFEVGQSLISDKEYDKYKAKAFKQDPNNKYFTQIGSEPENSKVRLPIPMFSLAKKTPVEAEKWVNEQTFKQFCILPKYDGTAGLLHYKNGKLQGVYTRGDGNIGRNVTKKALFIQGVWEKIKHTKLAKENYKGDVYIRGEFVMHRHLFKKIQEKTEYKSARNLCTGMLNKKDLNAADKNILRKMTFVAFGLDTKKKEVLSTQLVHLSLLHFIVATNPGRLSKRGLQDKDNIYRAKHRHIEAWIAIARVPNAADLIDKMKVYDKAAGINLDGLVISHDVIKGATWAVKLENYNQKSQVGIVKHIEINKSDRNILKPVVVLKTPLDFDGAAISRITAHNMAQVRDWRIGIGSKVTVHRSGDVIPFLSKCIKEVEPTIPKRCSDCNTKLSWTKSKTDLYCPNENCTDVKVRLTKFFEVLKTDVMGPGNVNILIENGFDTLPKLLRLKAKQMATLPGFANKKAKLVEAAIRSAVADVPLHLLMKASGIFADAEMGLGGTRLKKLVTKLGDKVVLGSKIPSVGSLNSIDNIGPKIANLFIEKLPEYRRWHNEIAALVSVGKDKVGRFTGCSYCYTGFRDSEQERYITQNGGEVKNNVTKNLTALFASTPGSSKATQAKKYGIPVILVDKVNSYLGV